MVRACSVEILRGRIASGFSPEKITLFGSRARGEAGLDSDVDLLVVLPVCEDRRAATIPMTKAVADLPVGKDIIVPPLRNWRLAVSSQARCFTRQFTHTEIIARARHRR